MLKRLMLAALMALCAAPAGAQTVAATTNSSVVITLGNTFQTALAAVTTTAARRSLTIQNNNATGTDNCWVFVGAGTPTKGTSIVLSVTQAYTRFYPYVPADAIQVTCATTNDTLYVDIQ